MKKALRVAVATFLIAGPTLLIAQNPGVITARQENFKRIGRANKGINDELKKSAPSLATIGANALALERGAAAIPGGFPRGSASAPGVKTEALPAIWERPAVFRASAVRLRNAARDVRLAAARGNLDAVKAAVPAVGASCKSCHESFRAKR